MHEPDPLASVGEYALLSRLGEGGMGIVHLAADPTGRHVALKLLRPHIVSDESGRARLAREVTSLRRVRSPRVASVYDADPWGHTPYVVTRYVHGPSLQNQVDRYGPVAGADLDRLAIGLAEALVAVHQADVLHRDIKPSNVLIEDRRPVLIDFGLAQLADDARITHTGWLLGTPGYLAPEILFGEDPTPKADVHAWAATVVFAATGRGPYGRGPAVAVMDRVRRGEHDLSGVPETLRWVVEQALLPDPRDRPTAEQVLGWLSGGQVADPMTQRQPLAAVGASSRDVDAEGWARVAPTAVTQARWDAGPATSGPGLYSPTRVQAPLAPVLPRQPTTLAPAGASPAALPPAASTTPEPAMSMALVWLALLLVVMAGAVTAPVVTAVALFALAWMLRTVSVVGRRVRVWRQTRGVRRGDGARAAIGLPWFAFIALPGAVINAAFAVFTAATVVTFATLMTPPRDLVPALAAGGFVATVLLWWGPGAGAVRGGARTLTAAASRRGASSLLVALVAVGGVCGLLGVRQVAGPAYDPLPLPPWEQHLRSAIPDLVTRAQQGLP